MLQVTFIPGFSPIQHQCTIEVASDGSLRQLLQPVTKRPVAKAHLTESEAAYKVQLTDAQLESVVAAVTRIDFERLAARLRCGRDASNYIIDAQLLDQPPMRVEGSIFSYDHGYHDFKTTFEPAQALWNLVYSLLPQKFMARGYQTEGSSCSDETSRGDEAGQGSY